MLSLAERFKEIATRESLNVIDKVIKHINATLLLVDK
jgi:hypothetical protein